MLNWPDKDPNETLDYTVNWTSVIGTDYISSSTWVNFPAGLTKVLSTNTSTVSVVWISGGTSGYLYTVLNRITTIGGRIYDQSTRLRVWDK